VVRAEVPRTVISGGRVSKLKKRIYVMFDIILMTLKGISQTNKFIGNKRRFLFLFYCGDLFFSIRLPCIEILNMLAGNQHVNRVSRGKHLRFNWL
jgi:hypothetical protein